MPVPAKDYWKDKITPCSTETAPDSYGVPKSNYVCTYCSKKFPVDQAVVEFHQCDHWHNARVYYINNHCVAGVGYWVASEDPGNGKPLPPTK